MTRPISFVAICPSWWTAHRGCCGRYIRENGVRRVQNLLGFSKRDEVGQPLHIRKEILREVIESRVMRWRAVVDAREQKSSLSGVLVPSDAILQVARWKGIDD